jgi:hypothetical protein
VKVGIYQDNWGIRTVCVHGDPNTCARMLVRWAHMEFPGLFDKFRRDNPGMDLLDLSPDRAMEFLHDLLAPHSLTLHEVRYATEASLVQSAVLTGGDDSAVEEVLDEMVHDLYAKRAAQTNNCGTGLQIQELLDAGVTAQEIMDACKKRRNDG